jgi:Fic family protein
MARKPYRVEINYSNNKAKYFLVKDINFKGKKSKVSKYLGISPPSAEELEKYRRDYAYELESKAAKKKAEISADTYQSQFLDPSEIIELEELSHIYRQFKNLLTVSEADVYEKSFEIDYIQGTTSIEGNTLSLQEAYVLLEEGILPKSKKLREINEVQNFRKVISYRNKYKGKVTLDFIKNLHRRIMDNIDIESAGSFRRLDVGISGCDIMLTPSELIESELVEALTKYYDSLENKVHPFEAAVVFHYEFEAIHPFTDGNGRVGREVFNYMLMREKFPKLLFLGEDRNVYLEALRMGNEGRNGDMVRVFFHLIQDQRMKILKEQLRKAVLKPDRKGQTVLDDFLKQHR